MYRTPGGFHHPALAREAHPIPDSPFFAFRISIEYYHESREIASIIFIVAYLLRFSNTPENEKCNPVLDE